MADRLVHFIAEVRNALEEDFDFVLCIDGKEGVGKSTLGGWCKAIFDGEWNLDHVTYDGPDFLEDLNSAPSMSALWVDEAKDAAYKRLFYSELNIALAQAFGIVRSKNYFIILNIPNYWDLDPDIRPRVDYRLYVSAKNKRDRGHVEAYEVIRTPWTKGDPYMKLRWRYRFPPAPREWYNQYYKFKTENQKKKLAEYRDRAKGGAKALGGNKYVKDDIRDALEKDPTQDLDGLAGNLGCDPSYVRRIARTVTKARERDTDSD